jgi:hypothetical protein
MAQMRIDQAGLSNGTPGVARKDGKSDGSLVTLTDMTPGGTTLFEILWVSLLDTTSIESLEATVDPHVWTFSPTSGVTGPIRIRLTHTTPGGAKTIETRIFGIPNGAGHVPPAPGERSDPNATRANATDPAVIARCERNWVTDDFPAGNPFGWAFDDLAGGGGGADATKLIVASTLNAEISTAYLCFASVTVTLPDASLAENIGKRITFTFSNSNNKVKLLSMEEGVPNIISAESGRAVSELRLAAGTYSFEALHDVSVTPQGVWALARSEGTLGRRSIDVDYCLAGELPTPYDTINDFPKKLRANESTPSRIPGDFASGAYAAGQTLLIPFDTGAYGLWRVNSNENATDWELQLLEEIPDTFQGLNENCETEYRIRYGEVWRGRVFSSNAAGSSPFPSTLRLLPAPLGIYPPSGEALDGNPDQTNHVYANDGIVNGCVNLIHAQSTRTLHLHAPTASLIVGERFALKTTSFAGPSVFTVVPDSGAIENVDGFVGSSANVTMQIGTYIEWMLLVNDSGDATWRIVSYISGSEGG